MRMFAVAMTDLFLILYLTSITTMQSKATLTVDDFYTLKSRHAVLQSDKQKIETDFQDKLRLAQEEQQKLAQELALAKTKAEETEKSLLTSDAEREQIRNDLKAKEESLAELNKQIEAKKEEWQNMEASYKDELQKQKDSVEASRKLAEELELKAQEADRLANQRQQEADLAYKTADEAKNVQQQAEQLKEKALKEKEDAERKAQEALAARTQAESERENALQAMAEARLKREQAEKDAQQLAASLKEIKQHGEEAFANNVRPHLQTLNVSYERPSGNNTTIYKRDLTLLPIKLGEQTVVIFPSHHVGFSRKTDKAPGKLVILYQGKRISTGWMNAEKNLIAVSLPGYEGKPSIPHPISTEITQFMPTLLALRNDGNKSLSDNIRGISDEFFIVNRDHLRPGEGPVLKYGVTGFRGTSMYGERIVPGDQLVDLNGQIIGVANSDNNIIRLDSLNGWTEQSFVTTVSLN